MSSSKRHDAAKLIAYVLDRFHETHRRELPEILRLARALQATGAPPDLADHFAALGEALESHMFKEEMRLFPMMEQGGSSLIGHLIDDMHAEHLAHQEKMARSEALLSGLPAKLKAETEFAALRSAVDKLFGDLAEHIRVEDDLLFPMFVPPRSA